MNLFAVFAGSFAVALSGAVAPGPLLAITIDRTLSGGFKSGPLLITGHALLEAAFVVLIFRGLSEIISSPAVNNSLSLAGGLMLVLMGVLMLRRLDGFQAARTGGRAKGSDIWSGVIGSLANPYWSIWWITIGMAYLALAAPLGIRGVIAFFTGHITADYLWYSAVSLSVSRGKNRLSVKILRRAALACGLFLAGFGTWFLVKGISGFAG